MRYLRRRLLEQAKRNDDGFTLLEESAAIFLSVPVLILATLTLMYGLMILGAVKDTANRQSTAYGAIPSILNDLNGAQPLGACNYLYDSNTGQVAPSNTVQASLVSYIQTMGTSSGAVPASAVQPISANYGYYLQSALTYSQCQHPVSYGSSLYGVANNGFCFYAYGTGGSLDGSAPNLECMWIDTSGSGPYPMYLTVFKPINPSEVSVDAGTVDSSIGVSTSCVGSSASGCETFTNCYINNCWAPYSASGGTSETPQPGDVPSSYSTVSQCSNCSTMMIGKVSSYTNAFTVKDQNGNPVSCQSGSFYQYASASSSVTGPVCSEGTASSFYVQDQLGNTGTCANYSSSGATAACTLSNGWQIPEWMAALDTASSVTLSFTIQLNASFVLSKGSAVTQDNTYTINYTAALSQGTQGN